MSENGAPNVLDSVTKIVCVYLEKNGIPSEQVPGFVASVFDVVQRSLAGQASAIAAAPVAAAPAEAAPAEKAKNPAVPIDQSVTPEYIICLEDGAKLKVLKRYLQSRFGMTPAQYRAKWGLPRDYPVVAPAYSARRSAFAKSKGLGTKRPAPPAKPARAAAAPAAKPATATVAPRPRGRPRKNPIVEAKPAGAKRGRKPKAAPAQA